MKESEVVRLDDLLVFSESRLNQTGIKTNLLEKDHIRALVAYLSLEVVGEECPVRKDGLDILVSHLEHVGHN